MVQFSCSNTHCSRLPKLYRPRQKCEKCAGETSNFKGGIMKRTLTAAALFVGLITSAIAAPPTWQGDMFVTAVSNAANCSAVNVSAGDFYRTILRPKGLTVDSGPADLIA